MTSPGAAARKYPRSVPRESVGVRQEPRAPSRQTFRSPEGNILPGDLYPRTQMGRGGEGGQRSVSWKGWKSGWKCSLKSSVCPRQVPCARTHPPAPHPAFPSGGTDLHSLPYWFKTS